MRVEYETITTKITRAINDAAKGKRGIHKIHLLPEEWVEFCQETIHNPNAMWGSATPPKSINFMGVEIVLAKTIYSSM